MGHVIFLRHRLGLACHFCANGMSSVRESLFMKINPSSSRHTSCASTKGDRWFRLCAIAVPPAWFSPPLLRQRRSSVGYSLFIKRLSLRWHICSTGPAPRNMSLCLHSKFRSCLCGRTSTRDWGRTICDLATLKERSSPLL